MKLKFLIQLSMLGVTTTSVTSDLHDFTLRGKFRPLEGKEGHTPDLVINSHMLHKRSLELLQMILNMKEEISSSTFVLCR